ncbi:MAG: demethoxyubiquinone hydroxylase family protein [Rickettsiales bacterium]|nr:demethoxyubiquinone hydroxylase family protein [Rickettsiales bacterium]
MNKRIKEIIRVNQAGELGAIQIYKGQLAVLKNKKISSELKEMLKKELKHYNTFNKLLFDYNVRPTALSPIWKIGAFSLGVITAAIGKKSTMACTEAVEEVIIDHYEKQASYLKDKDKKLHNVTKKFCKEEKEHLDLAKNHDTGNDLFHTTLKKGIKTISKIAIKISEKV